MDEKTPLEEINTSVNKIDIVVSVVKGTSGVIPWIGPLVAEVIANVIPNQRIDRIDRYLKILASKLEAIEQIQLDKNFKDPSFVDLFEDSLYQATRALSPERLEHIASLIKNSLTEADVQYVQYKHILQLLGELNDIQILLLKFYTLYGDKRDRFWEQHKNVISAPITYFGSSKEEFDESTIHKSLKEQLVRLGLLRHNFKKVKKGEFPEFDKETGMLKASGYNITSFGKLLLRYIGMEEDEV